ncbi:HAD-IA family hydrolase [bacterium]|nr:HAD-IA family hydrolase [bacterium]
MTNPQVVSGRIDTARINALLFDVDGTLSNTDDRYVSRLARGLAPFDWLFQDRDPSRFARWLVMAIDAPANSLYSLADRLGLDKPFFKFINWISRKSRLKRHPKDRFWIIAGIEEMVATLHGHYPLAVVSARDEETTLAFLDFFGLTPYFDVIVTGRTCNHTKPFPEPVIYAANILGVPPEECLMIGDTIVDIHAGNLAGAQTAGVLCGFGQQDELERAGADIIVRHTTDLIDLLME